MIAEQRPSPKTGTSASKIAMGVVIGLFGFFVVLPMAMCGGCAMCGSAVLMTGAGSKSGTSTAQSPVTRSAPVMSPAPPAAPPPKLVHATGKPSKNIKVEYNEFKNASSAFVKHPLRLEKPYARTREFKVELYAEWRGRECCGHPDEPFYSLDFVAINDGWVFLKHPRTVTFLLDDQRIELPVKRDGDVWDGGTTYERQELRVGRPLLEQIVGAKSARAQLGYANFTIDAKAKARLGELLAWLRPPE